MGQMQPLGLKGSTPSLHYYTQEIRVSGSALVLILHGQQVCVVEWGGSGVQSLDFVTNTF